MITEETIVRVKSSLQATKSFLALEVIEELEKENAELKKQEEILLSRVLTLQKTNGSLTDKIEKMKCCGNCKKQHSCIKLVNFIYPEMINPINYGCINLSKWELEE